MNLNCEMMSAELTDLADWEFGDFPYGLEPLLLPHPSRSGEGCGPPLDPPLQVDLSRLCPTLLACRELGRPPRQADDVLPDRAGLRVYWFRWITGHQVAFVLWCLLAREIETMAQADSRRRATAITAMAAYVRGYCAMLLYTSSCPRDVYEGLIRPTMFLQHPGFSGTWAPDFAAIRHLFRSRNLSWLGTETAAADLRRAIKTYHMTHAGVAAKLVPGGRSLLQAAATSEFRHTESLATLYDNYFITVRSPTSWAEIVTQLLRRLEAVTLDLITNDLHYGDEGNHADRPVELQYGDVLDCERDFFGVMLRLAQGAAGLNFSEAGLQPQSV